MKDLRAKVQQQQKQQQWQQLHIRRHFACATSGARRARTSS